MSSLNISIDNNNCVEGDFGNSFPLNVVVDIMYCIRLDTFLHKKGHRIDLAVVAARIKDGYAVLAGEGSFHELLLGGALDF